jgi:truncated hemoglobin YjbI
LQKPQEHGALAHIFTKDWVAKLRNKLVEFLTNYLKSSNSFNQNNVTSKKMSFLQ